MPPVSKVHSQIIRVGTDFRSLTLKWKEQVTMRPRRILQFIFLGFLTAISPASALVGQDDAIRGEMTKAERAYLLSELKSSEKALLGSIRGSTQPQWTFKSSPDAWSIQECTEHLILAEDLIFDEAQKTLTTPPVARLANATSAGDHQVVEQMEDRSKKAKAPKIIQPTGKFPTPESAAKEFEFRRNKSITYVKTTHDPLRIHAGDGPSGSTADVYQFLLEMAAHSARHTAQIRGVKSAPGYPTS